MVRQRLDRADRQDRAQCEPHIGGAERFQHRGLDRERQALSAERLGRADRAPAALDEGAIRLRIAGRHHHALGGPFRADRVAGARERRPFAGGELPRALEHRVDHIVGGGGITLGRGKLAQADDMVEGKALFGGRGGEGHFSLLARPL